MGVCLFKWLAGWRIHAFDEDDADDYDSKQLCRYELNYEILITFPRFRDTPSMDPTKY